VIARATAIGRPISGRVVRVGDDVSTDEIFPGVHMAHPDPWQLGAHCLEGLDPGIAARVEEGSVLVAGRNFGRGSSREHAAIVLRACGFHGLLALSFGEIFERNALNNGLAVGLLDDQLPSRIPDGETLTWDPFTGSLACAGLTATIEPLTGVPRRLVEVGGVGPYVRERLADGRPGRP
jgi:3-isopropylmalate dehydratase small subunit